LTQSVARGATADPFVFVIVVLPSCHDRCKCA